MLDDSSWKYRGSEPFSTELDKKEGYAGGLREESGKGRAEEGGRGKVEEKAHL